jgi:hypothetical protein
MRIFLIASVALFLLGCAKTEPARPEKAMVVDPAYKGKPKGQEVAAADTPDKVGEDRKVERKPMSPEEAKLNKIIDQYVDSGIDGVVETDTDKNGVINRVVIVGAAKIDTILGAADGLVTARREARLRAAGKFRQFLEEKVSIEEKTETERVVKLEGKGGGDLSESAKKISKNTEKYKTVSEGMVRGLQTLGYKTVSLNAKERMYVVVMGWDTETSNAAKNLANELDKDSKGGNDKDKEDAGKLGDEKERRKLDDQNGVAPGAKKFFDKRKKAE